MARTYWMERRRGKKTRFCIPQLKYILSSATTSLINLQSCVRLHFELLPFSIFHFELQIGNAASVRQWYDKWSCGYRYRQRSEYKRRSKITANRSRYQQHINFNGTRYASLGRSGSSSAISHLYCFPPFSVSVLQSSPSIASPLEIRTWYGDYNDTFNIELPEEAIVDGNTTLQVNLKFVSQLSDTLQGFYRVLYQDSDSSTKK